MNEIEKLRMGGKSLDEFHVRCYRLFEDLYNPKVEGGYLYLIQLGETDHYKIGITRHMDRRLKQLSGKSPIPLKVLYFWWGHDYRAAEAFLHKQFASKRVKGEWFQFTTKDLFFILETLGDHLDHLEIEIGGGKN